VETLFKLHEVQTHLTINKSQEMNLKTHPSLMIFDMIKLKMSLTLFDRCLLLARYRIISMDIKEHNTTSYDNK